MNSNTLCKAERLSSKKVIEQLFAGGSTSFSIYPLRVVFMPAEPIGDATVTILISVSKKRFKRAVKRNRIKRQLREAYRKNKHGLTELLNEQGKRLIVAFIYLTDEILPSAEVEGKMKIALARIMEKAI